ncbi:MAG: SRPBCC family protein [Chitinophagaceae bacterium]
MKAPKILKSFPLYFVIPVLYALVVIVVFSGNSSSDILSFMSMSFLFTMPAIMGFFTVYLAPPQKAAKTLFKVFAPWLPIILLLLVTVLFHMEGWACWIMILPLFLIVASIGGVVGAIFNERKHNRTLSVSFILLLPFLVSPAEKLISFIPGTYKAYTYTDIHAPAEKIWRNVTRVREIPAEQDKGWLTKVLGFPRPVKAELNYLGVGAYREAVFTNGLVFHETVTHYRENEKMVFSIRADPYDIPSTTLDKHVVIGGQYFDVLNGTYELEKLGEDHYRLHLYSHFKLATNFNFYASWWAKWIMKDIQQNILQVEKFRAENE